MPDEDKNSQLAAPNLTDPQFQSTSTPAVPSPSTPNPNPRPVPSTSSVAETSPSDLEPDAQQVNRTELLQRARSFLTSPQIQHQDISAKRRFLEEKGLSILEIDGLLRELPVQTLVVPPRSYPQLPPSNLPNLLLGLFRLFTWLTGGSATLIFVYHRFLLPRLTRSYQARSSLVLHCRSLIGNLTTSISALKSSQADSFSVLPRPQQRKEDSNYSACHTIAEVLAVSGNSSDAQDDDGPQLQAKKIPEFSLLRCALEEFANEKASMEPSTAELFQVLETRIPWLATEEGVQYQNSLWQTLTTCPLFQHSESESAKNLAIYHWSYHPPTPPTPSPLLSSLSSLSSSLPPSSTNMRPSQHTLQTLTDFTGYLTTQVYSFPFHIPGGSHLSPAEEELRREIRALKGLVLNRRSFMPAMQRPASASSSPPST